MSAGSRDGSGITILSTTLGWGGTEGEAVRLAREYARRGLSPRVIVDQPPLDRLPALEEAGIPVVAIGFEPNWTPQRYRDAMGDALRATGARLLHCHIWERLPDVCAAAHGLGIPVAFTAHTTVSTALRFRLGFVGNPVRYARTRRAFAQYDPFVINISDLSDANFRSLHPRVTRTRRIYYGAHIPPEPVDPGAGGDAPQVLWVGSFTPRKRPLWALDVWSRIVNKYPRAHLAMVGGGPQLELAKQIVAKLPAGSVTLVGNTPDVPSYLRSSRIFLHTALREGIPTVMIEAINNGLPVVACNAGAIAEAVKDGQSGYLTSFGESQKMANHLSALISDPAKRVTMGRAARAIGERQFGLERYVDETLQVYTEISGIRLRESITTL